jgi:RloB-like protein
MNRRQALVAARPGARSQRHRERRVRVLICCEGKLTETHYFRYLQQVFRSALVSIEISPEHGDPWHLVEVAKAAKRGAIRERDVNREFDQVWCVSDVDEHARLSEARQAASDAGVSMAISNPCFELWLLLHFQDQTAYLERNEAARQLRNHIAGYEKALECGVLAGRYGAARTRAQALEAMHVGNGSLPPDDNPSSGVLVVVEALREASERAGALVGVDDI